MYTVYVLSTHSDHHVDGSIGSFAFSFLFAFEIWFSFFRAPATGNLVMTPTWAADACCASAVCAGWRPRAPRRPAPPLWQRRCPISCARCWRVAGQPGWDCFPGWTVVVLLVFSPWTVQADPVQRQQICMKFSMGNHYTLKKK